jgi:glycosyltransferase involved in cell wall biosynthesis
VEVVRYKICLMSDHHLCINPRLWKEAFFYEKKGYDVTVLTMWQSEEMLLRDREMLQGHQVKYKAYLNLIPGQINPVFRFFYRLRKRIGSEMQKRMKIGTPWAISHAPELLLKSALQEKAHHYAAHLESAFWAGVKLIKWGKQVSFDFEDWYSRDYLTPDRAVNLLKDTEAFALKHGVFCTAASQSMADALQQAYAPTGGVTVIFNSFPDEELDKEKLISMRNANEPVRLVWTSRTVGPKRGLETLLKALELVHTPVELHIIGKCADGYEQFLKTNWPSSKHRLVVYDFIPHHELLQKISTCDLGLAIEQYEPDSRDTTVTNKILQYLQAGLAVLATDTKGQQEVAAHFPESAFLVKANDPAQWALQLEKFVQQRATIDWSKQQEKYQQVFSWQVQEQQLKKLISNHL